MTTTLEAEEPRSPNRVGSAASATKLVMVVKARAKAKPNAPGASKSELVLKKLRTAKGSTVVQLAEVTGWQAHSVRGFLSGTVKKKLGLDLRSDVGKDGLRRYHVIDQRSGTAS